MIDLHTHILPGVDDGAKTPEMSHAMLRMEWEQGVDTVVLTPHFYRYREEPERFLIRRRESYDRLREWLDTVSEHERAEIPNLILGCEVAWSPDLPELDCLSELCIGDTNYLLLELPFSPWTATLGRRIHDLMSRTGITPILAHLERYIKIQTPERMEEIVSLGLPVQISADTLTGILTRRGSLNALGDWAHIVASDCHNTTSRPPCMGKAMDVVRKKLGCEAAEAIDHSAYQLAGVR